MNWRSSQNSECETFMLAEMVCGNVTRNLRGSVSVITGCATTATFDHAEILARVKEGVQRQK